MKPAPKKEVKKAEPVKVVKLKVPATPVKKVVPVVEEKPVVEVYEMTTTPDVKSKKAEVITGAGVYCPICSVELLLSKDHKTMSCPSCKKSWDAPLPKRKTAKS